MALLRCGLSHPHARTMRERDLLKALGTLVLDSEVAECRRWVGWGPLRYRTAGALSDLLKLLSISSLLVAQHPASSLCAKTCALGQGRICSPLPVMAAPPPPSHGPRCPQRRRPQGQGDPLGTAVGIPTLMRMCTHTLALCGGSQWTPGFNPPTPRGPWERPPGDWFSHTPNSCIPKLTVTQHFHILRPELVKPQGSKGRDRK